MAAAPAALRLLDQARDAAFVAMLCFVCTRPSFLIAVQSRFDALQGKLVPLWRSIQSFNQDEQTIVIVPSITLDFTATGAVLQAYEERFLFLLFLLRQPRARVVYVTSQTIAPEIVEYYLDLLPGVPASHARRRLFLVAPLDGSARPLSQKLLEPPATSSTASGRSSSIPSARTSCRSTRRTSNAIWPSPSGIPMYGADPRFLPFGTKSGARRIFAEVGVAASPRRRRISPASRMWSTRSSACARRSPRSAR